VLQATQPDLLILDEELLKLRGVELCQAIRSDSRWNWLPVLFLTGHTQAAIRQEIYVAGADDYLTKPILPAELVTRILNRLERTRLLRSQTGTDLLTGLANRQRGTQDLEKLLHLSGQSGQPLCLALLEPDQLQQINYQHTHTAGDRVLRGLAQLLRQHLRPEDSVARWSGAQLVVGWYGLTQRDGVVWLTELQEKFRALEFTAPSGDRAHATFSAGVVEYPGDGQDVSMLYWSADATLAQAKKAGGDRVLPASDTR
jgi:diguanylate cyclase (GGDEF)-like protein